MSAVAPQDLKPENLMMFNGRLKLIDVDGCVPIDSEVLRKPHVGWGHVDDGIRRVSVAAGSCQVSINDSSISFSPCYCAPEWTRWAMNHGVSLTVSLSSESEGFRMTCLLDHFDVTLLDLISMSS